MKKAMLIIAMLGVCLASEAKKVKFAVDMTGQTVNTTGVHVTGDFQEAAGYPGGNWQSNTTSMSNEAGTEIYSVVVDIPAFAKYEYKFLNGDMFYDVEFVPWESRVGYNFNDNRWIWVDSTANDTTFVGAILFGGNAPAGKYLLRFMVDLKNATQVSTAGVHVAGDFQGWDPALTRMFSFSEYFYEHIAYIDTTVHSVAFRYVNGNSAGEYETVPPECASGNNRTTDIYIDLVLDTVCFSGCTNCGPVGITRAVCQEEAVLYPNPASDYAVLNFNDHFARHDVAVCDISGHILRTYQGHCGQTLIIEKAGLEAGLYMVSISYGERQQSIYKFILQ
jgi:hypothetical protein